MRLIPRALLWLLLVPYFAVVGLNVEPWFGGARRAANRANGIVAVAIILMFLAFPLLKLGGVLSGFGHEHPTMLGLLLSVPSMVAVGYWLDPIREAKYRKTYAAMPARQKTFYGLTSMLIIAGSLWLIAPR